MPLPPADALAPSRTLHALATALDESHDVKAEVKACADDLGSANELAKVEIAYGAIRPRAAEALRSGLAVERRAQGCADDLQEVTENLAHGVEEVKVVEQALTRSLAALARSKAALTTSRNAEPVASQLAMHDQKTGLPNRTLFDDRLAQAIAGAERHHWPLAVMFLDLDGFGADMSVAPLQQMC